MTEYNEIEDIEFDDEFENDTPELAEVTELSWRLFDEQIDDEQFQRLERLILASEENRDRYIKLVNLHCGLMETFRPRPSRGITIPMSPTPMPDSRCH